MPISYEDVGIDLGVTHFGASSNREFIESPRHYRRAAKKLKKLQEALSRKKRSSHRRARAVKRVASAHHKIRNQRRDFARRTSRKLTNRYQVVVLEKFQTANLTRRRTQSSMKKPGNTCPMGQARSLDETSRSTMPDGDYSQSYFKSRQHGPDEKSCW